MNKHEACPNCPSSDAYWVYEDGHGYCFSCKTVTRPSTLAAVEARIQNKAMGQIPREADFSTTVIDTSSWTSHLPSVAHAWLSKYGITANEIKENDIYWDADCSGLVFVVDWVSQADGQKAPSITSIRNFSQSGPKYLTKGKKQDSKRIWGICSERLILCEDILSAIKIGRTSSAKALLGVSLPSRILQMAPNYARIDVWLDPDKRLEALNYVKYPQAIRY